jgi:hypothetical protein
MNLSSGILPPQYSPTCMKGLPEPDFENEDPFLNLPEDFPAYHSRIPQVLSPGYGSISFLSDGRTREERTAETNETPAPPEVVDAFRRAITEVLSEDEDYCREDPCPENDE